MIFKACTRCRGDLYRADDIGQAEFVCLQCGHRLPAAPAAALTRLVVQPRRMGGKQATQLVRAAA